MKNLILSGVVKMVVISIVLKNLHALKGCTMENVHERADVRQTSTHC